MANEFEVRLRRMLREVKRPTARKLDRCIAALARLTQAAVRWGGFESKPTEKRRHRLSQEIRTSASVLDACAIVEEVLFKPKRANSQTHFMCSGNVESRRHIVKRRVRELIADRSIPNRGQCYVAWSLRPERFLYVGMGKSKARLDPMKNVKLAQALGSATSLTLVFPSSPARLPGLEASLIAVIKAAKGARPRFNDRDEKVPVGDASREVEYISAHLELVAEDLYPSRRIGKPRTDIPKEDIAPPSTLGSEESGQPPEAPDGPEGHDSEEAQKGT